MQWVATKVFAWSVVLVLLQDQALSSRSGKQCVEDECGGRNATISAKRNGEVLCSGEGYNVPALVCEMKCRKEKPDEDQLQCWKGRCAVFPEGFCEKAGEPSIKADQCEEYLNDGKVKYYGWFCPDFYKRYSPSERRKQTVNN